MLNDVLILIVYKRKFYETLPYYLQQSCDVPWYFPHLMAMYIYIYIHTTLRCLNKKYKILMIFDPATKVIKYVACLFTITLAMSTVQSEVLEI